MPFKTKVKIVRQLLPYKISKIQKMQTKDGRLDFLGQLLVQWGYTIPETARSPQELLEEIPLLVASHRGVLKDTALTLSILDLDPLPRDEQERKFVLIMETKGVKVTLV